MNQQGAVWNTVHLNCHLGVTTKEKTQIPIASSGCIYKFSNRSSDFSGARVSFPPLHWSSHSWTEATTDVSPVSWKRNEGFHQGPSRSFSTSE